MGKDELPDGVRRLIAEHITSVEQLEILLLLRSRPDSIFTAAKVSEEMRTSELSAAARLADLRSRGFLTSRDEGGVLTYSYAPESDGLRRETEALAAAYAERRYTIIDLIFAKPITSLHLYADAFRFRKDRSDG